MPRCRRPPPFAVIGVPDEPGAVVLPGSEPTVQAVAADLDADGAAELIRLVGVRDGALAVDAWRERDGIWELAAPPLQVAPRPSSELGQVDDEAGLEELDPADRL